MNWSEMSNTDIRLKISTMKDEYEAVKNKINKLLNRLDELDMEYLKAQKELEERAKK